MLEEENGDHDDDNDNDLPPSPKRTRTRNTLDEDETDIANDLRLSRPSRLPLPSNSFDEENGSQEGDEYRGRDEGSDPGDADRDLDNGMNFGNEDEPDFGGEEFGDNGVCVSSFMLFIELILCHFRSPLLVQ